jgi:hypothetical protein
LREIKSAAILKSVSNYRQTSDPNFALIAGHQPGTKIILGFKNLKVWKDNKIKGTRNNLLIFKDWSKYHITA